MTDLEVVVTIKTTESELNCILWALTAVKTIRLPIDPKWKKPYNALLKDMRKIRDDMIEAKRDRVNDQRDEPVSRVDIEKEIQMSQGTYVAGCKGDDCD
jgi:hypothetical protein|tara:strand:+ start:900 stop:1196 length:297 start_codon:yes stop_codon:yes gene_type:complete